MLLELNVKDLILISAANLEFGPGLTVLTGETGAGKTALLSALKLLVGERGDAAAVRDGAAEARVEALFSSADKNATLQEHVVARRLTADGRSRCTLDDSMVTVKALAETIGPLVDLYGQHEHQSLLRASEQLAALDNFGGESLAQALGTYQTAWREQREAAQHVEELTAAATGSAAAREQAAFVLREINAVDPQPDEYEQLKAQLPVLQNGEDLARATSSAVDLLRGDGAALDALAQAASELETLRCIDPKLDGLAQQLSEIIIGAEDLGQELRTYRDSVEFDAQALEATLERLGQLEGLCRRFGPTIQDVLQAKEQAQLCAGDSSDFEERLTAAQETLTACNAARTHAAHDLASLRQKTAQQFCEQLATAVHELAMPGAAFAFAATELPPQNWTLQGSQSFELLYRPQETSKPRPLARIASGGELSRVMLALKTLLHTNEHAMTLVFDEIDAGIGGATANAVAERLAQLARTHQVLVVTHLAQIAVLANDHLVVSKTNTEQGIATTIHRVSKEERVKELARMLSGNTSAAALDHARELLNTQQGLNL
jgi:DNA repair protein RecN (Recombination protein N)